MSSNDAHPALGFARRPGYPMSFRPSDKHLRVVFADTTIVDATHAMVMLEDGHMPVYYFRRDEVRMDLMDRTSHSTH